MDACPDHILESTKGIEIKLGTYINVNKCKWEEVQNQEPNSYCTFDLSYLSLILFKKVGGGLSCLLVQVVFNYKFCLL